MAEGVYIYRFIWAGACLSAGMNIDCEIGIRGDSCQRGGLIWGPQALPACLSLRHRSVAALHGSHSLLSASVSAREACLPLCVLIFLLEWLLFSPSSHSATCTRSLPLFHSSSVSLGFSPFLKSPPSFPSLYISVPLSLSLSLPISHPPLFLSPYIFLSLSVSLNASTSLPLYISLPLSVSLPLYTSISHFCLSFSLYTSLSPFLCLFLSLCTSLSPPHLSFSYSSFI